MSLNVNGEKCVVCKAYLFPEDDVVYCPHCGAPHHRDCYNSVGHCALEEYHNTENEYKKPEPEKKENQQQQTYGGNESFKTVCRMCGEEYPGEMPACPKCGTPDISKMGGNFVSFDFLGGIPGETDLGEGVTANEAKMFVNSNTHRYIPKFAGFKYGKKTSWNWLAFLTPSGWLVSRKMYGLGVIIGVVQIALAMLSIPFSMALKPFVTENVGYAELTRIVLDNIDSIGNAVIIAAMIGSLLTITLSIIMGIFGDLIYKKRVISKVNEIKRDSEDKIADYRKKGGVSLILGALTYYLINEIPTLLALIL